MANAQTIELSSLDSRPSWPNEVGIGLLGCGVVGGAVAAALISDADNIAVRAGVTPRLHRVAVLHPRKPREVSFQEGVLTSESGALCVDPSIDIVIEAIGGIDPALTFVRRALLAGKSVVTANKELVAEHGDELSAIAAENGVGFYFEASVGAAVPIVRVLTSALAGEHVTKVSGILNGTTNFVLTEMRDHRRTLAEAVVIAQARGYAEFDPSVDISGKDAAWKLAILARLAFGGSIPFSSVGYQGIESVTLEEVLAAEELGCSLKLVARAERTPSGLSLTVRPTLVPREHELGRVDGRSVGVVVESSLAERLFLSGPGAGGDPTASAILGDLIEAVRA